MKKRQRYFDIKKRRVFVWHEMFNYSNRNPTKFPLFPFSLKGYRKIKKPL